MPDESTSKTPPTGEPGQRSSSEAILPWGERWDAIAPWQDRFRPEFKPAFDAWMAQAAPDAHPPGTPFDLPQYQPSARRSADQLNAEAEKHAATARRANQLSDNFVLVAVVMASVLFFAGVGTKVKARGTRLFMLVAGFALFVAGVWFMLSMPQNFGL